MYSPKWILYLYCVFYRILKSFTYLQLLYGIDLLKSKKLKCFKFCFTNSFDRCPKSNGDETRAPTMCLVCGQMLCSQSYCCQTELDGVKVGAATEHSYKCGAGVGIFLRYVTTLKTNWDFLWLQKIIIFLLLS